MVVENKQFFDENTRFSEIRIHCLVNRSRALRNPKDKNHLDNRYYAQHNYTAEQIPLAGICEDTLLKGYQFVPGEFTENSERDIGIRNAKNWKSQQVFLIEFDNTTENTLNAFITARPFLEQNGWLATESIRSRYDDPDDETCNGQLRPRLVFCMPRPVKTRDELDWVYDALVNALPGCDDGSANSITNGGLGRANAEHIKIGKIVDIDWFNSAIATGRQKKAEADKTKHERAEKRKRKQKERAAMGFTEREGELPLEALAKTDPSEVLESLGLSLKGESGQYQHWGRPEKQGDTALSVWQSAQGNWQIRVFANSIPVPPSVSGAMPFTRFYCYHELNTDIEGLQPDSTQWKDINAQLASRGYGTWLSDDEFHAQNTSNTKHHTFHAPVRLSVCEYERETEQIEKQQEKISAKLREWEANTRVSEKQHLLNVTTAAGTRKTTVTVHQFDTLLYIAKTKEEADQAFSIADSLERDAWRHRPRMYNRDEEKWNLLPLGLGINERPCIHPETCNILAQGNNTPVVDFCQERCEVYDRCRQKGFLSQTGIERKKQSVFLSWNEAFFSDEQCRSRVKLILNKEKMLVLDEADPAGLPQHRQLDLNELPTHLENWRLPDPEAIQIYLFLKKLIQELSTAKEPEQIRNAIAASVKNLTVEQIHTFDSMLSKIPLGVVWNKSDQGLEAILLYGDEERRVFVSDKRQPPDGFDGTIPTYFAEHGVQINTLQLLTVSLDVLDRAGFLNITEDPEKAPRRFTTLLKDLKTFAESNSTACHRTKSTIDFFLPPGLNAPRGITLTASDKNDHIREVYRGTDIEVETLTGLPPPFQPRCKYFQIATGRYTTKKGLLRLKKEKGEYVGVTTIFKRMLKVILKIADRYDVLVVAPKGALNAKLDTRIAKLHTHPNVEFINHHHAEGRNDFQHCDVVFVFNFEPRPDEIEKIARRIYRTGTLNFNREETDVEVEGVKLTGVKRYKDERVQKVYDRECESRHMQALMRLRPMINGNKMMVSFSAEPVSRIPIPPVPFVLPELETFILKDEGDLADFDTYLENKAYRSVKDIVEEDGVSESTAYRRTENQRSESVENEIKIVLKLKSQELSIRKIADKTGFSRGKVEGILKRHKVS